MMSTRRIDYKDNHYFRLAAGIRNSSKIPLSPVNSFGPWMELSPLHIPGVLDAILRPFIPGSLKVALTAERSRWSKARTTWNEIGLFCSQRSILWTTWNIRTNSEPSGVPGSIENLWDQQGHLKPRSSMEHREF